MLLIWSTLNQEKTLGALSEVLQHKPCDLLFAGSKEEALALLPKATAVVTLGSGPFNDLQALGVVPKNRSVASLRMKVLDWIRPLMVTYSPGVKEVDYRTFIDMLCDVRMAFRLASTGSISPKMGEYKYVPDLKEVVSKAKLLLAKGHPIDMMFDTETVGLDYVDPTKHLVSLQFTLEPGEAYVVYFESLEASQKWLQSMDNQMDLGWLLSHPNIRTSGANGKFDLLWVWFKAGIECTNYAFDTTLVGSLLDENRSNGLDIHAKLYTDMGGYSDEFDATIDKSRMDLVPKYKLLPYAGGDTDAGLRVKLAQKEHLLADGQLTRFYLNILHPAARAFEIVERGGVFVDKQEYDLLEADLRSSMAALGKKAKEILGGRIVAKHWDPDKPGGLNLGKPSLLIDFMFSPMGLNLKPKMFTAKSKAPSSTLEHLELFRDVPEAAEFVKLMSEYTSASKTLGTYVEGFKKHLRHDGRFHPSYWLHTGNRDAGEGGTVTGRLSCTDPAFQCCVGETLVLTDKGQVPLLSIVQGSERGEVYRVLTHTGEWKRVVGVYRNGTRPVFRVTTAKGRQLVCTGNHPLLTPSGWVKTEDLSEFHHAIICSPRLEDFYGVQEGSWLAGVRDFGHRGTAVYGEVPEQVPQLTGRDLERAWVSNPCAHQQGLGGEEADSCTSAGSLGFSPSSKGGADGGAPFGWGPGQQQEVQSRLGDLLGELKGYGAAWPVHPRGVEPPGEIQQLPSAENLGLLDLALSERGVRDLWREHGYGITDQEREALGFERDPIVSISPFGEEETFDLTIEDSHSFVANGLVVHNTIPKHTMWGKRIRRVFKAPDGMLVLENDYSQGELKVIACIAHEETMIHAYQNNMDLHVATSAFVAGLTYEEMVALSKSDPDKYDALRQLGKAGNFGLIYGMGVEGFIDYARAQYGVTLEHSAAAEFHAGFFKKYPALPNYHKQYKEFARKYGYVRSPLGRVRHLPLIQSNFSEVRSKAERQAVNSPVQGALSDMMIWCIALGVKAGWHHICPPFGMIHDAKYTYIPEDNYQMYAKREVELMENLPFHELGWSPQLKFTADAKVGPNMADLSKVKF